ncbi:MAG: GTPase Era [Sediminibacterium sp.]|nr:GTPase Era [Sediminibacterium sp.]
MKVGFVNIFGKPNAGKSTLLNALMGEKLAIVSSKVQTTRHRIKAFLSKPGEYQIIFSDTPGIIEAKYKLHEKMMAAVKSALEDADVALLLVDITSSWEESDELFQSLRLKVPTLVIINKIDQSKKTDEAIRFFSSKPYAQKVVALSALQNTNTPELVAAILELLPEGFPFYSEEDLSDLPTRFFVSELVREKIYELYGDEIPYHTAVLVNEYKEKGHLVKIQADIIVQRETQKMIVLGEKGKMIRELGTKARIGYKS